MLPAAHRMRSSAQFTATVSRGRRLPSGPVVVHLLLPQQPMPAAAPPTVAGLVVGKAVGGAVVRHRVSRRLRHVLAPRMDDLPPGSSVVVRALPRSAACSSAELAAAVDDGLRRGLRPRTGGRR